jgi:putative NADH-flavin reductase
MKVALIGASGNGGSRLLAELSRRGHQVMAIARNPDTIAKLPGVTAKKGDVFDKPGLVQLIKGHDAVISAVHFTASDPKLLIEAVKESGVKRYFVVGGAGSLEVAPGVKLIDTPQFPTAYKAEAAKGGEFLELLRKDKELDWTFLSPSALIAPGERTGKFRLGKDQLLTHDKGSNISWEDYASGSQSDIDLQGVGEPAPPCPVAAAQTAAEPRRGGRRSASWPSLWPRMARPRPQAPLASFSNLAIPCGPAPNHRRNLLGPRQFLHGARHGGGPERCVTRRVSISRLSRHRVARNR